MAGRMSSYSTLLVLCFVGISLSWQAANDVSSEMLLKNDENFHANTTLKPAVKENDTADKIRQTSMTFFSVLVVLALCVIIVSILVSTKVSFIPESLAVMIFGACLGIIIKYIIEPTGINLDNWEYVKDFQPDTFFIILLPPIIFESGYTLQKGDFFSNMGPILTYALLGTTISAVIIGFSMFGLGRLGVVYPLNLIESFSFGSLISATDPVCTLALFQSMNVDVDLYAIVFGESVLNDAVSIVLTVTFVSAGQQLASGDVLLSSIAVHALSKFCLMLFVSALVGIAFALVSALILMQIHNTFLDMRLSNQTKGTAFMTVLLLLYIYVKYPTMMILLSLTLRKILKFMDLRGHHALEICLVVIFAYLPYGLSEGLELSGIMAILLCGITMSHYTHFNLSPLSQIAVQQVFRVIALIAETLVFVYLGMAITNSVQVFDIGFISLALLACLAARAVVIFPLSLFFIFCRQKDNRVSLKILFLIWFSGLRGAVAYAQSLYLPLSNEKAKAMIITTTLAITVFTNVVLGSLTLPMVKLFKVQADKPKARSFVGKSHGLGKVVGPSQADDIMFKYKERKAKSPMSFIRGWRRFDRRFLMPFFIREKGRKAYQEAVESMIVHWTENEERTALFSSAEYDELSPLLKRRVIRPVRRALQDGDVTSEAESDSGISPMKRPHKVVKFRPSDSKSQSRNRYGAIEEDEDEENETQT